MSVSPTESGLTHIPFDPIEDPYKCRYVSELQPKWTRTSLQGTCISQDHSVSPIPTYFSILVTMLRYSDINKEAL